MVCDPWPPDLGDNREWWGPWENQRAQTLLKERTAIQLQLPASMGSVARSFALRTSGKLRFLCNLSIFKCQLIKKILMCLCQDNTYTRCGP